MQGNYPGEQNATLNFSSVSSSFPTPTSNLPPPHPTSRFILHPSRSVQSEFVYLSPSSRRSMNPSSRPAPAQRIGPARLGQPASSRNFSLSSAGGAGGRNHLDSTGAAGQGNGSEAPIFGAAGKVAEGEKERERRCRKEQAWGESYVRFYFQFIIEGTGRERED